MDFFQVMFWPLLACLILAGIHAYLGMHVIEREVIFVDLALAQIAVLGPVLAMLAGWEHDSPFAYLLSVGLTLAGAGIFSLTRFRTQKIPQEAVIGIVYAVAASLMMMLLSRSGEGDEHLRQALLGDVLLVGPAEASKLFLIYTAIGILHFICRKKFLLISQSPDEAFRQKINVRLWDFIFYASFGIVVTSSVQIAGVLLVFAFLIIPSAAAVLFSKSVRIRLSIGWIVGATGSMLGMVLSYFGDFPTGASVVCSLAGILIICSVFRATERTN